MSSNNPQSTKNSGKCNRTNPPCKYLHPPQHLRDILLQNGRNNLILRSIAMNIAANQAIYPQTATHLQYPNGAIIQNHLQQPTSIASYPHMGTTGSAQSTLVFNSAGQAFSIPFNAAHLKQMQQAANTTMYSPDGTQYYQPVTQLTAQPTGPKLTRTDRLEVYSNNNSNHDAAKQQQNASEDDGTYTNGYLSPYQQYPGQLQAIYAQAQSVDLKDPSLINSANVSNGDGLQSTNDMKAVIDPVSSSSITQQTKKRPLEDDTATTGAYLQLPPGAQIISASQYVQQQQSAVAAQHQKRSAVADPKTGIPMAAYPLTAFSYPSPSPLPIQFQQPYLTAVPMTFTGYTSHLPRL
jgi:hypothetical protein